jgi:hypothetical protein
MKPVCQLRYAASRWKVFETNVLSKLEDVDQIVAARSTIDTRSHNKIVEWQLAQCIATEAASNAYADRSLQMHHIKRLNVAKPLITKMVQDIVDSWPQIPCAIHMHLTVPLVTTTIHCITCVVTSRPNWQDCHRRLADLSVVPNCHLCVNCSSLASAIHWH